MSTTIPRNWLDEIAAVVEGLRCDGVRDGRDCNGHMGIGFDIARCEAAQRVVGRIQGLLDGVNLPQPEGDGETPWSDLTPMLAALTLPIPPEGMEPLLNSMRIIYGEPVRMESKGNYLFILQQAGHPEGESGS